MATKANIEVHEMLDAYVASDRKAGRRTMTAKERTRFYGQVEGFQMAGMWYSIRQVAPERQRRIFKELVDMSLAYRRRPVAVPAATVRAILDHPFEGNLAEALFPIACMWLDTRDLRGMGHPPIADLRRGLSRTLRLVYTLFCLEGELCNGGFEQYLENGHAAHEALADCRLAGAKRYADLLKSAIVVWGTELGPPRRATALDRFREEAFDLNLDDATRALEAFEAERQTAFWKLDAEFNVLEEEEALSFLIVKYVRKNHDGKRTRLTRKRIRKR